MGDKLRTILNLEIVKSDLENNLIYLKGSIPGSKNSTVFLRESVKNVGRKTIKEKHEAKIKASALREGKIMKFPLLNIDGTKSNSIELSDKVVKLKINYKLIKFVIDWQLNHSKPRTAKTKQRNQIRGSTKKIVAQKEVVEQGMLVEKHLFLLVEELPMDQKVKSIRSKRLIKKSKNWL